MGAKGGPKTGGRKPGAPNRVTREKRELIAKFIENKWEDFVEAFNAIDKPVDKCRIMVDIMPFAVPKLASVEYKDMDKPKTTQDELDELTGLKTRG